MSVTVLGTRRLLSSIASALLRPHTEPEVVRRQQIPYWQQRGWTRSGNLYTGNYQTPYGAFSGMAEDQGGNFFRFYLFDPPAEVRRSSHWACFQPRRNKGYLVHMATMPADIGSGIMTIERLITEAFQG